MSSPSAVPTRGAAAARTATRTRSTASSTSWAGVRGGGGACWGGCCCGGAGWRATVPVPPPPAFASFAGAPPGSIPIAVSRWSSAEMMFQWPPPPGVIRMLARIAW